MLNNNNKKIEKQDLRKLPPIILSVKTGVSFKFIIQQMENNTLKFVTCCLQNLSSKLELMEKLRIKDQINFNIFAQTKIYFKDDFSHKLSSSFTIQFSNVFKPNLI